MRLVPYGQSLAELVLQPKQFYNRVISSEESKTDLFQWETFGDHLFFDIDDTLGIHKGGMSQEICRFLDHLIEKGKSVHLLTNCSQGRADDHLRRLSENGCKAEFWPHGLKPDYIWLRKEIESRGMNVEDCCFYGDRPTMDLWMAWKAGFGHRVWVKGWRELSEKGKGVLGWTQNLEWKFLAPYSKPNRLS